MARSLSPRLSGHETQVLSSLRSLERRGIARAFTPREEFQETAAQDKIHAGQAKSEEDRGPTLRQFILRATDTRDSQTPSRPSRERDKARGRESKQTWPSSEDRRSPGVVAFYFLQVGHSDGTPWSS